MTTPNKDRAKNNGATNLHLQNQRIQAENNKLRAQIAKLTAPPSDAEIAEIANIIAIYTENDYSEEYEAFDAAKAAITKWLEMRS